MSLKTVSNMIYQGDIADLPPLTAPMPRGGVYYADLVNSLFVSKPDSNFSKNRNYATYRSPSGDQKDSWYAGGELGDELCTECTGSDRRELCAVGPDGIRASCRVVYPDRKHDE